jgi:type III secretory pathway component EscU
MNWFGLFTTAMIIVLVVWIFAYEWGYEQAEKDMHMSRQWVMRNHPTNGDWQ